MSCTTPIRLNPLLRLWRPQAIRALASLAMLFGLQMPMVHGMDLTITRHEQTCRPWKPQTPALQPLPPQADRRIPDSQAVAGQKDIAWVWLASPTLRYPHRALGSPVHAGSVHALVKTPAGAWSIVDLVLPMNRVYEDRVPRIVDLDQDGSEEVVLIEADLLKGASLVVLGIDHSAQGAILTERARGPFVGSSFRWLNPVGVADFDGDGHLDLASVVTPHIGGKLQLLHVRRGKLEPFATAIDVSNHRMGALEQELAVVVHVAGKRPAIMVSDMSLRSLHALRWDAPGRWTEMSDSLQLPDTVERLTPLPGGACVTLADGRSLRVMLTE